MIRYALRCDSGHNFESWFQNSASFDSQSRRKLVSCPICDSVKVEKAIMAPRLAGTRKKAKADQVVDTSAAPVQTSEPSTLVMSPKERELISKLRELREHVTKNADNVGKTFPEQARKMHYGEIKHRPIYGEASGEEARALIDEGVEVAPLPVLPDDRN